MNINWCLCPHDFERLTESCLHSLPRQIAEQKSQIELEAARQRHPQPPTTGIEQLWVYFYRRTVYYAELVIRECMGMVHGNGNNPVFRFGPQCPETNMNPSIVLNFGRTTVPWLIIQVLEPWRCKVNQPLVPVISHTSQLSPSANREVQELRNQLDTVFMHMRANNVRYALLTDTSHAILIKRDTRTGVVMMSLPRPQALLIQDIFIISLISLGFFPSVEYGRLNDQEARSVASLEYRDLSSQN